MSTKGGRAIGDQPSNEMKYPAQLLHCNTESQSGAGRSPLVRTVARQSYDFRNTSRDNPA